jgi:hypothetical protein
MLIDPQGRFTSQEGHFAMTIRHSAAKRLCQSMQETHLSRWMLALAIMGAAFLSLAVVSHVRRATAAIENARITPIIEVIVRPSAEGTSVPAAPSGARPSPLAFSDARFRFGFLEFEDDADAPSR